MRPIKWQYQNIEQVQLENPGPPQPIDEPDIWYLYWVSELYELPQALKLVRE